MKTGWIDRKTGVMMAAGLGLVGREVLRRRREADLHGQVALVTGGSRGLGYLLARDLLREGCRVAICARDEEELERARRDLDIGGAQVLAVPCDITDRAQVQDMLRAVVSRFGSVDILVNNAGVIQVGPISAMTIEDFEQSMNTMFWGVVNPTLAVLPEMRTRGSGRITNITSIGGRVSIPHLMPYSCAKFAAVAFSEGLRAELAGTGITVTTVAPGLMRTGSHVNASFKGHHEAEMIWFSLAASMPGISMDAERAAGQIVRAIKRGDSAVTLTIPTNLLQRIHGLLPGTTADVLGVVNHLLPTGASQERKRGQEVQGQIQSRAFDVATAWGATAARRFNEGPSSSAGLHGTRREAA
jgi:NAD(P)-dependent dehydrogenase (short-subunit alcohol dehydrogenase family)